VVSFLFNWMSIAILLLVILWNNLGKAMAYFL